MSGNTPRQEPPRQRPGQGADPEDPGLAAPPGLEADSPPGQDRGEADEVALDAGGDDSGREVIELLEPREGLPPVIATASL